MGSFEASDLRRVVLKHFFVVARHIRLDKKLPGEPGELTCPGRGRRETKSITQLVI